MRQALATLKSNFLQVFEDPSTSGMNEGKLYDLLKDMLDTFTPAYGVLTITTPSSQNLTTANALLLWETVYVEQLPEYTVVAGATSAIARNDFPATNQISVNMDVDLAVNREVEVTLFANGVATPWRGKASGSGSGRPAVLSFEAFHYSAVPVIFSLRALVDVATEVIFSNAVFLAQAVPVREA